MNESVVFMGSKSAGFHLCEVLCDLLKGQMAAIICPNDLQDARSEFLEFKKLAERYSIPLHIASTRAETLRYLVEYDARYVFVHGWYQIIPVNGRFEFYGFHYSCLPKYRGNAPLVWQIINGEPFLGVSFFRFSEGMDEGELVAQERFELGSDDTVSDALNKANALSVELAKKYVREIVSGQVILYPQPSVAPSYCGLRVPEDGRIDWSWSADRVHNFIRAQSSPYPGAFTFTNEGERVAILRSSVESRNFYGVCGGVVEVSSEAIVIACGVGAIRVTKTLTEGGLDGQIPHFLRSLRVRLK